VAGEGRDLLLDRLGDIDKFIGVDRGEEPGLPDPVGLIPLLAEVGEYNRLWLAGWMASKTATATIRWSQWARKKLSKLGARSKLKTICGLNRLICLTNSSRSFGMSSPSPSLNPTDQKPQPRGLPVVERPEQPEMLDDDAVEQHLDDPTEGKEGRDPTAEEASNPLHRSHPPLS